MHWEIKAFDQLSLQELYTHIDAENQCLCC
jgi:hypothetical protein